MSYEDSAGLNVNNHYGPRTTELGKVGHRTTKAGQREMSITVTPESVTGSFSSPTILPAGSIVNAIYFEVEEAFDTAASTSLVFGRNATNGANLLEANLEAAVAIYDLTSTAPIGEFDTGVLTDMPMDWFIAAGSFADATVGIGKLIIVYTVM